MSFIEEAQLCMEKCKNIEIQAGKGREGYKVVPDDKYFKKICKWSLKIKSSQLLQSVPFLCELLSAQIAVDYQLCHRI